MQRTAQGTRSKGEGKTTESGLSRSDEPQVWKSNAGIASISTNASQISREVVSLSLRPVMRSKIAAGTPASATLITPGTGCEVKRQQRRRHVQRRREGPQQNVAGSNHGRHACRLTREKTRHPDKDAVTLHQRFAFHRGSPQVTPVGPMPSSRLTRNSMIRTLSARTGKSPAPVDAAPSPASRAEPPWLPDP